MLLTNCGGLQNRWGDRLESDWSSNQTIGQSRSVEGCRLAPGLDCSKTCSRILPSPLLLRFPSLPLDKFAIFIFYEILSDPTRFTSSSYQVRGNYNCNCKTANLFFLSFFSRCCCYCCCCFFYSMWRMAPHLKHSGAFSGCSILN